MIRQKYLILMAVLSLGWHALPVCAQDAAEQPSKIDAMVKVLLSENTDITLRENHTLALLQDPHALPALTEILAGNDNTSAKIIICRMIASQIDTERLLGHQSGIATQFVEPLFKCLFSDNTELAACAAQALSKSHDGIPDRLAKIAADAGMPLNKRLAAISVLEMIPERSAALALAGLLDDTNPDIKKHAASSLASVLGFSNPLSAEQITAYRNAVQTMNDQQFLQLQIAIRQKQLSQQNEQAHNLKNQIRLWRQRYLDIMTNEFNKLPTDQEKFNFLKTFLENNTEPNLKIWAISKIKDWSAAAAVQSGAVADPLVTLLAGYIADPQPQVRLLTAQALSKLINKAQPVAQNLMDQLKVEKYPQNQAALLEVLGLFESQSLPIDQALTLLKSDHAIVVAPAARALKNICGSTSANLANEQIIQIMQALAHCYNKWKSSTDIRAELLLAMRPLAAMENQQAQAVAHFDNLLKKAIDDPDENIRSSATRTFTVLHRFQAIPFLLDQKKLLDDKSPAVRFAVMDAIRDYGGKDQLIPLNDRLSREDNEDVAKAIRDTFVKIVQALTVDDLRFWVETLSSAQNHQQRLLHAQLTHALWDLLVKDKTAGQIVSPKLEQFTLVQLASTALADEQIPDAVKWYQNLIALKIPDDKKIEYHNALIDLGMKYSLLNGVLPAAANSLNAIIALPAGTEALKRIDLYIQSLDINDPQQLLARANILAECIAPLFQKLPDSAKPHWKSLLTQCALAIIDQQLTALNQNNSDNPVLIQLLPKLDNRLVNYPTNDPPEKKKAALLQFKNTLQPPPPPKPVETKPQTTPEAKQPAAEKAPEPAPAASAPDSTPPPAQPDKISQPPESKPGTQPAAADKK